MSDSQKHQEDLRRLRRELEKFLNWGSVEHWHSAMFKELSEKIYEASQVMLSPATLKRFFGVVNHQGSPSITTLNALCQLLGYENWREFKVSNPPGLYRWIQSLHKIPVYVLLGIVLLSATSLLISNHQSPIPIDEEAFTFSSRVLTNTYPNSVVFDFDLPDLQTDEVLIQQYWDTNKTIVVHPEQQQATGIYFFPGYFRAKLLVNGHSVREHDLFLKSNAWLGTVEYRPVPKYFSPQSNAEKNLTYPKDLVEEITESEDPLIMIYHFVSDLGNVSGDDFHLRATIRNTYQEKWAVCQTSRIYVLGTDGAMIIPMSRIGCSSDNNLMLNDFYLNGKEHDLSAFSTDLQDFTDIEILTVEKEVTVKFSGKEVYKATYQESMGRLVGLRFKFLGMGEVESFDLLDQDGNMVAF
ncbi:MAG: hypothetical protein AAF587_43570 [Bacteroidota bacterium]